MVYTFLAQGFEEIEALSVVDILRRADIEVKTVSVTDSKLVCGAHGIEVCADVTIGEITEQYDVIFLPGGYPGYVNLSKCDELISIIKNANAENKTIAAICAAPSVLGEIGILEGKTACCFPSFEDKLMGATVSFDDVCVSGNIVTSRGAGTAHKLAFTLVELLKDKKTADNLKSTMIYE